MNRVARFIQALQRQNRSAYIRPVTESTDEEGEPIAVDSWVIDGHFSAEQIENAIKASEKT